MLKITVELCPGGDIDNPKRLGTLEIAKMGAWGVAWAALDNLFPAGF